MYYLTIRSKVLLASNGCTQRTNFYVPFLVILRKNKKKEGLKKVVVQKAHLITKQKKSFYNPKGGFYFSRCASRNFLHHV